MNRLFIKIVTVVLLWLSTLATAYPNENFATDTLDGKSFHGKIFWSTFLLRWVRYKDTIEFKDGSVSSKLSVSSGYKSAPYHKSTEDGNITFTARAMRDEDDYFDWSGVFDGKSLVNVKMMWTKSGKVRTYIFKQT